MLCAKLFNHTRWTSVYSVLERRASFREHVKKLDDTDLDDLSLSAASERRIDILLEKVVWYCLGARYAWGWFEYIWKTSSLIFTIKSRLRVFFWEAAGVNRGTGFKKVEIQGRFRFVSPHGHKIHLSNFLHMWATFSNRRSRTYVPA